MDKVMDDLLNLMLRKSASVEYRLFEILRESQAGCYEIEGDDIRRLLQLNELAHSDADRYFSMIEQTGYHKCAYALLLLLTRDYYYVPMDDSFGGFIEKAGLKGLALIIKALLAEYVNLQNSAQDNGQLIMQIFRLRADVRPSLILTIVTILIYETQGALDVDTKNVPGAVIRQRKIDLLKKIIDAYNQGDQISTESFECFFGITQGWDVDGVRRAEETGRSLLSDEKYAAALMVSRQLELELSSREYEMLVLGALYHNSQASSWQERNWRTLSAYLVDAIASRDDAEDLWQRVSLAFVQALHRQSHRYYLGDSSNGCREEVYLCMLPNLVDKLLSAKRMGLAVQVWERAWNDCLTALYSWTLPVVPFYVAQLLFYHKVMDIPAGLCPRSSVQMLDELPLVFLPGGSIEDTANACLLTVSRECKKLERIKIQDPLLYHKLELFLANQK